ncbi:MAG: hypothetical protein WD939_01590 [Dehalococcoidia bacterium]
MPPAKLQRIQDAKLRESLTAAHAALGAGNYKDVVQRAADAYLELLKRKPELLEEPGFMGRMRIMMFPRLGARLEREEGKQPTVVWDRETFGFAEAVTYFEFAVDQLIGQDL